MAASITTGQPPSSDGAELQAALSSSFTGLAPEDEAKLVDKICKAFDRMDRAKGKVRRRWKKTKDAVRGAINQIEAERFTGLVPYGKQSHQTLISHVWGRSLQSEEVLFAVRGDDEQSQTNAQKQKQNLLDILRKDQFQRKMDDSMDDTLMKGVVISHIGYKEKKEQRQVLSGQMGTEPQLDENGSLTSVEIEQTLQDSGSLTLIDAHNFVFDTTNHDNWDECFKAYRYYEEYENIADDPNFQNYEELKNMDTDGKGQFQTYFNQSSNNSNSRRKQAKWQDGVDEEGRIELIEFHGNIRLPDGTYVRNWMIVIGGRKKVIRFEKNPYYICPFIKWTYERTEDGWGVSPLDYIVPLIAAASTVLNTSTEAVKLNINPAVWAPKGMLPQKKLYLTEGRVVEYEINSTHQTVMPEVIPINGQAGFEHLSLFETQCEATTGATRQLSGNVTSNDKAQTATEFSGLQIVGNLIIDRVVDLFNLYYKIPCIEKIAMITAMFNPKEKEIEVQGEKGAPEYQKITPDVYYGKYRYYIEDNKSELARKANVQQKIQVLETLCQDPELAMRLKKVEAAVSVLTDLGNDDAATWFMTDQEMGVKQIQDAAEQMQTQATIAAMQAQMMPQLPMMMGGPPNGQENGQTNSPGVPSQNQAPSPVPGGAVSPQAA